MTKNDNAARTATHRKRRGLMTGRLASALSADAGRRCIVGGEVVPRQRLIRFVIGPDNNLVPDLAETLPGRGLWLRAHRDVLDKALARNLFAKAARRPVTVGADLGDLVEGLLARRCLDLLGLARRAGVVVTGFEKVRAMLAAGRAGLLITAAGAAPGGRAKLRALAPDVPVTEVLETEELAAALGRGHVVHVAVARSPLADRIFDDTRRLEGLRAGFAQEPDSPPAFALAPDGAD